ncbi:MAG: CvpA family protein [Bacteroidota bacterium]
MVIDLLFLAFAGWGFYLGFNNGIIKTVFNVLSFSLGILAAIKFAPPMTKFLESLFNYDNPLMFLVGAILSFILIMLALRSIANILEKSLEAANINIINKAIGGGVLAGLMILLYSVLLDLAVDSRTVDDYTLNESRLYPILEQYPSQVWKLKDALQPTFEEFWDHSVDFLDEVKDLGTETMERTESAPRIRDVD